jgi:hypothetical protein
LGRDQLIAALRARLGSRLVAIKAVARNTGLRNLEVASAIHTTSRWIFVVALLFVAYDRGGALGVGAVAVVRTLPALATVPVAAAIGGRRRERVLLVLSVIRTIAAGGAAMALALDLPMVLFLAAGIDSFVGTLRRPLHAALVPSLAHTPEELVAANVATNLAENSGSLIGPALGGALLAVAGPDVAVAVAAVGFAIATGLLRTIRDVHRGVDPGPEGRRGVSDGVRALVSGTFALGRTPGIRLVGALLLLDALLRGALAASIVVVAVGGLHSGGAGIGLLTGMPGLGGLVGVALAFSLLSQRRLSVSLSTAILVGGIGVSAFGLLPGVGAAALALVVVGGASAVADIAATTLLQRAVPRRDRTRVLGALEGLAEGAAGAGTVAASLAITAVGVQAATAVGGFVVAIAAVLAWLPVLRWERAAPLPGRELELARATPLFAPLPIDVVEEIAGRLVHVDYPAGSRLITEGEQGDALYLLASGSAEVRAGGRLLTTLHAGDAFGEIALLRKVPRTATVEAREAVCTFRLDAASFVAAVTGQADGLRAAEAVVEAHLVADASRSAGPA